MGTKQYLDIPLNGKLITAVDPIKIQPNDFQQLINLRPTDDTPKGVRGMTKINASATNYLGVRTGYHFKKDQPSENHILVQTNDTVTPFTASRLIKSDNSTSIPAQDTFSTFLALGNNNPAYFSKAPDGCVAVCNSTKNYIWGGDESRCYGFMVFDPDNTTNVFDYTDVVNNTLTDSLNVATLTPVGGGIDTNTKILLHFENNGTDSSGNSHTFTAQNGATYGTTYKKFGSYGGILDGVNYYWSCGDSPDFDCSGGKWSADMQVNVTSLSANRGLFSHDTNTTDYLYCYVNTAGAIVLSIYAGGVEVVNVTSANNVITLSNWHHIEVSENDNDYYIFVNGAQVGYGSDAQRPANYSSAFVVGACYNDSGSITILMAGYMDEFRLSVGAARHITGFSPPISAYSASAIANIYLASTRPLKGCKMYPGTANAAVASAPTGTYWNGSWAALTTVDDNTDLVATKTLSGPGTITWDDTQSDAKVSIINNQQYYWYKLAFTGIDATTTIYHCTLDAAIQPIKDIWDGTYRTCLSMLTYQTSYEDHTLEIYKNDYYASDSSTYVNISDMTAIQFFVGGFSERTMALYIGLAGGYANTTAATTCTIYYWNGSGWATVGTLNDGTSQTGISFSRSGIISWDAPTASGEFTWTPNNGVPLYYYKVAFDKTIDNTDSKIYINIIAGIPAQSQIGSYKFPLFWQNRVWLCGNQSGRKNMARYSSMDTSHVFNGLDSGEIPVDGDDELMAGATLFTRFGGDIYDSAILCKRGQTFLLEEDTSSGSSSYKVKTVSTNKGCIAPYTMRLCDIGFDIAQNIRKHILVWLSDSGLMVFDGVSMGTVSDYFDNVFDPLDTDYINRTYIDDAYGEYDPTQQEYILCVPMGSTPTWKEIHYRLKQQAPFYVDRGTGKALRCAFQVEDSNGTKYVYGGTNDGFIERLEFGTTMDTNGIGYTIWPADFDPTKTALRRSRIHGIQFIGKTKSVTTQNVAATHYVDGETSGTALSPSPTIDPTSAGYRIFRRYFPTNGVTKDGVFHSTKFTITTTDENRGFEPLLLSYIWSDEGEVFD